MFPLWLLYVWTLLHDEDLGLFFLVVCEIMPISVLALTMGIVENESGH
jgi:hypothetical protein